MSSMVSLGLSSLCAFLHALATKPDDTSNATAIAVPHVQTLDMVDIVLSESNSDIDVVMPTAMPV